MNATLPKPVRYPSQTGPTSFYLRLKEQMLDVLVRGGQPGERVPSERQLAKQFDASTMTIARILQEFQSEGLLQRVPGKGTFICEGVALPPAVSPAPAASPVPVTGDRSGARIQGIGGLLGGLQAWTGLHSGGFAAPREQLRHTWILVELGHDPEHKSRGYWSHRATSAVERGLQRAGVRTTLINRTDFPLHEIGGMLPRLQSEGVDSVVLLGDKPLAVELWGRHLLRWRASGELNASLVQVCFGDPVYLPVDSVTFNGAYGVHLATDHLQALGHRKIAFVTRRMDSVWLRQRIGGFLRALEMANVERGDAELDKNAWESTDIWNDPRIIGSGQPPADIADDVWIWARRDAAEKFVEARAARGFTAAVAVNDQVANELVECLREHGLRVPEDVSVVGFDDSYETRGLGLTTIHPPIDELGDATVALLTQRHQEAWNQGNIELKLNPALVVRTSTAAPGEAL